MRMGDHGDRLPNLLTGRSVSAFAAGATMQWAEWQVIVEQRVKLGQVLSVLICCFLGVALLALGGPPPAPSQSEEISSRWAVPIVAPGWAQTASGAQSMPVQGLELWFKADNGVSGEENLVSGWADLSGHARNASQPESWRQPVWVANGLNGLPVLHFDGVDDYLSFHLAVTGMTGITLVLVSASDSDQDGGWSGAENAPLFWNETAPWGTLHLSPFQRLIRFRAGTGQVNNLPIYSRPENIGSTPSVSVFTKDKTREELFVDGTLVSSQGGKLPAIANVDSTGNLGRGFDNNTFFKGGIAEVLVYSRVLEASERILLEMYLQQKYGTRPPLNWGPIVTVDGERRVTLPGDIPLAATVIDDGAPAGELTCHWWPVEGPGTVVFSQPDSRETSVGFSSPGTYLLRFSASDGELATTADVIVVADEAPSRDAVMIQPGESIQGVVDSHAPGTTYYLAAGIHRAQTVSPKRGDTFTGATGTVLNGALLLTSWSREGSYWVASEQWISVPPDPTRGAGCLWDTPRCRYAEELFFDGRRLRQVSDASQLSAGAWFYDASAGKVYVADNPEGRTVERSVTQTAFAGSAPGVTIRNLIVEDYANYSQSGAVGGLGVADWSVENCVIRNNHGAGVRVGARGKVRGNRILENGQIGLLGNGDDLLVEGNEIAFNNAAGYDYSWEAGGTKFLRGKRLVARNNFVHDNRGPGLWTDYDNWFTVYESNRTARNKTAGIDHELSFDAVIRNNIVENEPTSDFGTNLWYGAGIINVKSRRVLVYENTVINCGNGIGGAQDGRTGISPTSGETFDVAGFQVRNNVVIQSSGLAGGIVKNNRYNGSVFFDWGNLWLGNSYRLWDANATAFQWAGGTLTPGQWRNASNDTDGVWSPPESFDLPETMFEEGDRVVAHDEAEVRDLPSTAYGRILTRKPAAETGSVTAIRGPIRSGGKWWWQVRWDSGGTGWTVQDVLVRR